MDNNTLSEEDILDSIEGIKNGFGISFGQAQKGINVILKYHYYLTRNNNQRIRGMLNCPLDSIILDKLLGKRRYLTKIGREEYLLIQGKIKEVSPFRIDYDNVWDRRHLEDAGLL